MKQILLICAVMALVGCGKKDDGNTGVVNPNKPSPKAVPVNIADPIVEKAIRKSLKKPTGELTKADLEKVTRLSLKNNQLTDVSALANLTQLEWLFLDFNQLTELPKGLEKLTNLEGLYLANNRLTEVTGLEKLSQLEKLSVKSNFDLTKAQIDELQKALPKCEIHSNPTK